MSSRKTLHSPSPTIYLKLKVSIKTSSGSISAKMTKEFLPFSMHIAICWDSTSWNLISPWGSCYLSFFSQAKLNRSKELYGSSRNRTTHKIFKPTTMLRNYFLWHTLSLCWQLMLTTPNNKKKWPPSSLLKTLNEHVHPLQRNTWREFTVESSSKSYKSKSLSIRS